MSELAQAIEEMRNMQQSYDQVAGAAEAYNTGKVQLAANITAKGVPASATETLPELAEKVAAISQETYEINGGEMYAKQLFGSLETPNYWNLYEVLANLLSDGRLVSYGGILLAEYYKGYDSLALSGAGAGGAYVVSDKDSDGNFIMYTNDTTHVWATEFDGKGNRWVAYCFADAEHDFEISDTATSPRSIYIGRHVGTIRSLVNGRCSKIVVTDGNKLNNTSGDFTQDWDKHVVFRNIQNCTPHLCFNNTRSESIYAQGEMLSGAVIKCTTALNIVSLVIDFKSSNGALFYSSGGGQTNSVREIIIKAEGNLRDSYSYNNSTELNNLKNFTIIAEGLNFAAYNSWKWVSGTIVTINYITNDKTKTVAFTQEVAFNKWINVQDLRLKDGWCKPLDISLFTGLTEANMYAHILQRLKQDEPDCGDGVTITLGSTNLAKLTSQESIDLLDLLTNIYGYTFA